MDKFDCLKVFARVARLGTFTAAANELNTTQSAVSKKIAWLESDVGIALFHRHPRAVSLTHGGKQYLEHAITLIDNMQQIETRIRQEQTSIAGNIKLSVPSAFSTQLLAAPLDAFLKQHGDITIDISVSDRFVDLVEGDVDIAIRASYLKDSGLKARWFMDNVLVYFASPSYLAAHPPISTAEDLTRHKCLTYSLSSPSNLWRFAKGEENIKIKVNEHLRSDSPELLVDMAKRGQGIAAMPRWMIENELHEGRLQLLLEQYDQTKLPMYIVYKDSEYQPQSIRAFIDFMVAHFTDTP